MRRKAPEVRIEVETRPEPINLQSWADTYVRHVLSLEGVDVRPGHQQPTVFAEAG